MTLVRRDIYPVDCFGRYLIDSSFIKVDQAYVRELSRYEGSLQSLAKD